MHTVDFIWNGVPIKDERHLGEVRFMFVRSLQKACKGMPAEMNRKAEKCTNELQRVQSFKKHFKWKEIPNDYFSCLSKNPQLSLHLKDRANKMYKEKHFLAALRGYNLAVMFAPTGSQHLGLAYGNRSALFMETQKYDLALRDIKLAMENNYPIDSLEKLKSRESKCKAHAKNNNNVSESDLDPSINFPALEAFSQENYKKLKSPNNAILNAESFVKIDFTEKCGRRFIATKPIESGTLICAERPYSHMLVNALVWDTEHCHYCCRPILGGLPCPQCSFSLYCSEDCREKSLNSYHRYEHKIYTYFHHNPGTCLLRDALSLRILFTVGPHELFRIFKTRDTDFFADSKKTNVLGFNSKGVYDSSSYLTVYHLISHLSHLRSPHLISNCFKAFVYTHILQDHTDFFSSIDSLFTEKCTKEGFKDFITSVIIHHMENIPFNAISMSKLKCLDDAKLIPDEDENSKYGNNLETIAYAMATYSLLSLCNHSCDPNVIPLRKPSETNLSLVTLKNIKAGEELCISYGPIFHLEDTEERMEFLQTKYNFQCECIACKNKWGPKTLLSQQEIYLAEDDTEHIELKNQLLRADDLITKGKFIEATEMIKPCLIYFTKKFPSTHPLTKMSQDLFKRALVWLFNAYGVYT